MSGDPTPGQNPYTSPTTPTDAPESLAITQEEKLWAMLAHLAGLLGYAVALGQYIGPLVIYLLYKDKSRFIAFHALQSLYFQLGLLVATAIGIVIAILTCGVGAVLLAALGVVAVIYVIIAALRANQGDWFEYWLVGAWARKSVGA
jgi:uncharacterized Tic20 family protein